MGYGVPVGQNVQIQTPERKCFSRGGDPVLPPHLGFDSLGKIPKLHKLKSGISGHDGVKKLRPPGIVAGLAQINPGILRILYCLPETPHGMGKTGNAVHICSQGDIDSSHCRP